jgi:hypothetical protein
LVGQKFLLASVEPKNITLAFVSVRGYAKIGDGWRLQDDQGDPSGRGDTHCNRNRDRNRFLVTFRFR